MTDYDVVVVGAGAAELVASRSPTDAGYKVLVLERWNRIGRRAADEVIAMLTQ